MVSLAHLPEEHAVHVLAPRLSVKGHLVHHSIPSTHPTSHHFQATTHSGTLVEFVAGVSKNICNRLLAGSCLCFFEDDEAVILMVIQGRSPNLRHVARTHRVDLDLLFHSLEVVDVVDPVLLVQQHRVVSPCCHFSFCVLQRTRFFSRV